MDHSCGSLEGKNAERKADGGGLAEKGHKLLLSQKWRVSKEASVDPLCSNLDQERNFKITNLLHVLVFHSSVPFSINPSVWLFEALHFTEYPQPQVRYGRVPTCLTPSLSVPSWHLSISNISLFLVKSSLINLFGSVSSLCYTHRILSLVCVCVSTCVDQKLMSLAALNHVC